MIKFTKPNNLNGAELIEEFQANGVATTGVPVVDGNNDLWLDIAKKDQTKAQVVVDAHNGTTIAPKPTIEQKLASVGLSIDDLKTALNL